MIKVVLWTDKNMFSLAKLRGEARQFGVHLIHTISLVETLDKFYESGYAILLENKDFIEKIDSNVADGLIGRIFYLQEDKVFALKDNYEFFSISTFFKNCLNLKSGIEEQNFAKRKVDDFYFNFKIDCTSYKDFIIKAVLVEMYTQKCVDINLEFVRKIAERFCVDKHKLGDYMMRRYEIYGKRIYEKTNCEICTNRTKQFFCDLYNLIFV